MRLGTGVEVGVWGVGGEEAGRKGEAGRKRVRSRTTPPPPTNSHERHVLGGMTVLDASIGVVSPFFASAIASLAISDLSTFSSTASSISRRARVVSWLMP